MIRAECFVAAVPSHSMSKKFVFREASLPKKRSILFRLIDYQGRRTRLYCNKRWNKDMGSPFLFILFRHLFIYFMTGKQASDMPLTGVQTSLMITCKRLKYILFSILCFISIIINVYKPESKFNEITCIVSNRAILGVSNRGLPTEIESRTKTSSSIRIPCDIGYACYVLRFREKIWRKQSLKHPWIK